MYIIIFIFLRDRVTITPAIFIFISGLVLNKNMYLRQINYLLNLFEVR